MVSSAGSSTQKKKHQLTDDTGEEATPPHYFINLMGTTMTHEQMKNVGQNCLVAAYLLIIIALDMMLP